MERNKLMKQFVDFIFTIMVAVLFYYIGNKVGTITTESKYKSDYMKLSLEVDSTIYRVDTLAATYKRIQASPCFMKK